jgi:hypothetical protein
MQARGRFTHNFRVRVLLIVEDSTVTEMQNSNKSAVPLLEFMSKCESLLHMLYPTLHDR